MEKLKRCRKCGEYPRLTSYSGDSDGIIHRQWYVVCSCVYGRKGYETKEEAIEAWNRRADDGTQNNNSV